MPSDLERAAARFRADLLRNEAAAAKELVDAYGAAYQVISRRLQALTGQIEKARQNGQQVGPSWLFQQERLQRFTLQVADEIGKFARTAGDLITREQAQAVSQAQSHAAELMQIGLGASERDPFLRMPVRATEHLAGHLSNGSPLRTLLNELGPDAAESARKRLIAGVATGQGPKQIATGLREDLGGNLNRALTISRTETLRAYRESSRETYQANEDVVGGWIWLASLGGRTCPACLAMHGTVHPLDERMGSHPNCRCTMLPRVRNRQIESGEEWLRKQPERVQKEILGEDGAAAFRAGEVQLRDFVKTTHSEQWGTSRTARGLKGARAAAQRREATEPAEIRIPDTLRNLLGRGKQAPVEFASRLEAEEWARKNIRGLQHVDFEGADLDVVSALNRTAKAIGDRYQLDIPAIAPNNWSGWTSPNPGFMAANREGIQFNPQLVSGRPKLFFVSQWELGEHTSDAAKGLDAIAAHELAHVLETSGRYSTGRPMDPEISLLVVRKYSTALREKLGREEVTKELSGYAWRGDGTMQNPAPDSWRETWAQAFSAYFIDRSLLSSDVVTMVETILRELHRL